MAAVVTGTSQGFQLSVGVSTQLVNKNLARRSLTIQNLDSVNVVYIAFGTNNAAVASPLPNGFALAPGCVLEFDGGPETTIKSGIPQAALSHSDVAATCLAGSPIVVVLED